MNDRKITIQKLEEKRRTDTGARNRLLEELGENLLQRTGSGDFFPAASETGGSPSLEKPADSPGSILAEYRGLEKETADSSAEIKNLEADIQRLKELEAKIASAEERRAALDRELAEVCVLLGRTLLLTPGSDDYAGPVKQKEELLLAKIGDHEKKLEELEEKEGGVLAWLGKNAQIAVSKTLLLKDRAALDRLYRDTGEKYLSVEPGKALEGEMAAAAEKAAGLKERLSSLITELDGLRAERRKITELSGGGASPARRIQGLQKHIAQVKGKFPALHLRFGVLAAENGGNEALRAILGEGDAPVLEKAESLRLRIAETGLEIEKNRAAASIDAEKAEIEKIQKVILNQRQKIAAAQDVISDLENQIAGSERHIEELRTFLKENEQVDHGGKNE